MTSEMSTPPLTPVATRVPVAARVLALAPGRLIRLLNEGCAHGAIDLALGIPEAPPTPPTLIDAACLALRNGSNQYEAPNGNIDLRRWIAGTLGASTDPDTELIITVGATEALSVALLSTVDPGDEVVVFEPVYENFLNGIVLAGGVPKLVRVHPPDWRFDPALLRAAFGPRTRAIVLCTPNNPTGHMLTQAELTEIAELCERWNAIVISDEVYKGYVFDDHRHISVADSPALRDRSFVVGSLSKSHAVSGWRLGYLRAAASLTAVARQVHAAVSGGAAAPLQEAVARAAVLMPGFDVPSENLAPQRHQAIQIFEDLGIRCIPPDGGCYVMADISPLTEDCESLAYRLVQEARVTVAPGRFFYPTKGPGDQLIRVAFNRRLDLFDEVKRRLAEFGPTAKHP